jgi:hypothetical protein
LYNTKINMCKHLHDLIETHPMESFLRAMFCHYVWIAS